MSADRDPIADELLARIFDPLNCFDDVHRQLATEVRALRARVAELEGDAQMWRSIKGMYGKMSSSGEARP